MRPTVPILVTVALISAVATTSLAAPSNKGHQLKATQDCPKGEICSEATSPRPPKKQGENLGLPNKPLPSPPCPPPMMDVYNKDGIRIGCK
jgi:hypothetical protein